MEKKKQRIESPREEVGKVNNNAKADINKETTNNIEEKLENSKIDENFTLFPYFQCPKCEKLLQLPAALPCGHLFCQSCLQSDNEDEKQKKLCFVCKSRYRLLPSTSISLNTFLQKLLHLHPNSSPFLPLSPPNSSQISSKSNENQPISINKVTERVSEEEMTCSICISLQWKPSFLSCGHCFCFWCINKLLSWQKEMTCPLCRKEYDSLPAPSLPLHSFLSLYYTHYHLRGDDFLDEEQTSKETSSPPVNNNQNNSIDNNNNNNESNNNNNNVNDNSNEGNNNNNDEGNNKEGENSSENEEEIPRYNILYKLKDKSFIWIGVCF